MFQPKTLSVQSLNLDEQAAFLRAAAFESLLGDPLFISRRRNEILQKFILG
jgi:hypothetical protein